MTRLRLWILYWLGRIIINIQTANLYYKYWVQTHSVLQVVAAVDKVSYSNISCPGPVSAVTSVCLMKWVISELHWVHYNSPSLYLEVLEVGRYEAGDNYSSKSSILRHHQAAAQILTRSVWRSWMRPHSPLNEGPIDWRYIRVKTDWLTGWTQEMKGRRVGRFLVNTIWK